MLYIEFYKKDDVMNKFVYNIIYVLIVVGLIALFERIFRNRKDNPTLNKIYKILVVIFWIIATIVTVLLYWQVTDISKKEIHPLRQNFLCLEF